MSDTPPPLTYDQLYRNYNTNDLTSRQCFEMIYDELIRLAAQNKSLTGQIKTLMEKLQKLESGKK